MKTAISVPNDLYEAAERVARRRRMSRSRLYAEALRAYLHDLDDDDVTERLNRVYSTESSTLDPVIAHLQSMSLPPDEW